MIGTSVFAILQATSGANVLNEDGTYRIFPNYVRMGDKMYPQFVYDCENYAADHTMDNSESLAEIDVKILCVAQTYDAADALTKTIVDPLDGSRGMWGSTTINGCFLDSVSEDHFVDTDMETILYYTKELLFKVTFNTTGTI